MDDYEYKYLKYKNKYNNLKQQLGGGGLPKFVSVFLSAIQYGTEEIPYAGELEALFLTILNTAELTTSLISMINGNNIYMKLAKITFSDGPDGVLNQFTQIWNNVSPTEKKLYCESVPILFNKINTLFSNWISTIPEVGPPLGFMLQNTKILTYNHMVEIYKGFPDDSKKLFQDPDTLNVIMGSFKDYIKKTLSGGGFLSGLSHMVTSKMENVAGQNLSIAQNAFETAAKPAKFVMKTVGVDKKVTSSVLEYTDKIIKPSTVIAIEGLKLIIPLFYTLLLITEKCK